MKRIIACCTAIFLFCWPALALGAAAEPTYETLQTGAKACIVMEAETGRILGGHNMEDQLPMASTTKIMTALLTLEQPNLDEWFQVDSAAIRVEGSSMGLQEGDQVTLRALVYGMLLPSGNDAANAAAVRIGGDQAAFVALMNQRAEELGLENTHFANPSGLDAEGHYSTALDMAKLCAAAMENQDFRDICCLSKAQVEFGQPGQKRWLENYNKLLTMYPYCIGVKTGFTEAAYRCLVSAAEKNGVTLICVTLNCADDWATHERLYEHYFAQLETVSLSEFIPASLPLANAAETASGEAVADLPITLAGDDSAAILSGESVSCEILCQPILLAPVSAGTVVGEAVFFLDGEEWCRRELLAAEDIRQTAQEKERSLIDRAMEFILQLF